VLKIRLAKIGKKHAPSYRIVVTPKEKPRGGEAVEILGHFNPVTNPPLLTIDKDRLRYWLEQGAQPTEAVEKLVKGKYEFKRYFGAHKEAEKEGSESGAAAPAQQATAEPTVSAEAPKQEETKQEKPKEEETPKNEPPKTEKPAEEDKKPS